METRNTKTRRDFIKQTLLSGTAMLIPTSGFSGNNYYEGVSEHGDLKVHIFSKHLQFLDYRDMCEAAKEMGFDGIDLTVRPKGHVLPERVAEDLPKATEAMKAVGLVPQMLSTNVIDANDPVHRKVLETASQLGYHYYRPAWLRYKKEQDVLKTVDLAKRTFSDLAEINKQLKISASYHNHSGNFYGASIWDLYTGLEDLPAEYFGSQYDIMHATVEGGKNWDIGLQLIKPYINTLVVKDFIWGKKDGNWVPVFTPIGEGMVDFKKYFALLKKYNINVPMSIHVEYDLGGAEHGKTTTIEKKEVLRRIKKDLDFVRKTWKES